MRDYQFLVITDRDGDTTELRTAQSDPDILVIEGNDMLCLNENAVLLMANAMLSWVRDRKFES